MKKMLGLLLAFLPLASFGQADIIAADRKIAWSGAGPAGGIPWRTVSCANLTTSNTLAQINSAIAACPAHQVVNFAAGTYNLTGGIVVNGVHNITLRGAGADVTILDFAGDNSCNGLGANICIRGAVQNDLDSPGNTTNWTAGYSKGTTVITLASVTNLVVGSVLVLDRINDSTTDNNAVWICRTVNTCCYDCATPSRNSGGLRSQSQIVTVEAINGTNVTISPAITWPNFASGATDPEAWYPSGTAITGVGIEGFTIDTESGTGGSSVMFANARDSWMRYNRIIHMGEKGIWQYQAVRIEMSYNYMYDKQGSDASQEGSESYGVNCYICSMWKATSNIVHHITSPFQCESGVGGVIAYNFSFDDFYNESNPDWAQASSYTHGTCAYQLNEGNDGFGLILDVVHAPNYFNSAFRNRYHGWEIGSALELQTVAIHAYAPNRYNNIVGNVLGENSYHTQRLSTPSSPGASCDTAIYAMGFGGNCGNGSVANKQNVFTSSMLWGNYDTVGDSAPFTSGEVPSGDANYPNSVPGDNNLTDSWYLTREPMGWDTDSPWPPIGPDVTGGDEANVGGHVHDIPAKLCYDNGTKTGVILDTDPADCFMPAAPTGLQ